MRRAGGRFQKRFKRRESAGREGNERVQPTDLQETDVVLVPEGHLTKSSTASPAQHFSAGKTRPALPSSPVDSDICPTGMAKRMVFG